MSIETPKEIVNQIKLGSIVRLITVADVDKSVYRHHINRVAKVTYLSLPDPLGHVSVGAHELTINNYASQTLVVYTGCNEIDLLLV